MTVKIEAICKTATIFSILMRVYAIPCHNTGHINVMLLLQSCADPLHILTGSSSETFPTSYDGTCDVSNVKVEEDLDMQREEVNVKTEEEKFIDIKHEDGIYIEEEGEEEEETDTNEFEFVDVKEEVSSEDTV
jgi:hypothetical protein